MGMAQRGLRGGQRSASSSNFGGRSISGSSHGGRSTSGSNFLGRGGSSAPRGDFASAPLVLRGSVSRVVLGVEEVFLHLWEILVQHLGEVLEVLKIKILS